MLKARQLSFMVHVTGQLLGTGVSGDPVVMWLIPGLAFVTGW